MQERQPSYRECAKLPILQRSIESTRPLENGYVLLPSGRFLAHPVSEISFSRKQVSVNRSQSQGKITMCEVSTSSLLNNSWLSARQVCHVRPRVQKGVQKTDLPYLRVNMRCCPQVVEQPEFKWECCSIGATYSIIPATISVGKFWQLPLSSPAITSLEDVDITPMVRPDHIQEVREHTLPQPVIIDPVKFVGSASYVSCRLQLHHLKYHNSGMSCEILPRWQICHMRDKMHGEVVHTGKL